jgi:hypothetical protein
MKTHIKLTYMHPVGSPTNSRPRSCETASSAFVVSEASDADEADVQTGASFDEALMAEMHKTGALSHYRHALPQLQRERSAIPVSW